MFNFPDISFCNKCVHYGVLNSGKMCERAALEFISTASRHSNPDRAVLVLDGTGASMEDVTSVLGGFGARAVRGALTCIESVRMGGDPVPLADL